MSKFTSRKYIHIVICTNHSCTIDSSHISKLHDYIREFINREGAICVGLNGMSDHVHILCILPDGSTMKEFVTRIKELSKQWVRSLDIRYNGFDWRRGYAGFVIRPPVMITVQHIVNQYYIHEKMSFEEEMRMFYRDHRDSHESGGKFWWDD